MPNHLEGWGLAGKFHANPVAKGVPGMGHVLAGIWGHVASCCAQVCPGYHGVLLRPKTKRKLVV